MFLPTSSNAHSRSASSASASASTSEPQRPQQDFPASSSSAQQQPPDSARGESQAREESDETSEAGPSKKPRLPRIAEACIRCKARKQRCVKEAGAEICKNCEGVKAECIVAPRARRKNTRSTSQANSPSRVSPAPRYAAPSPSTLRDLLRTDAPPTNPGSAFDAFAPNPEPSRSIPPTLPPSSWTPYIAPRPPPLSSYTAPPPPHLTPLSHYTGSHPSQYHITQSREPSSHEQPRTYWSNHNQAHQAGLVAPTSDVRNRTEQDVKVTTHHLEQQQQQRRDSYGKAKVHYDFVDEDLRSRRGSQSQSGKMSEVEEDGDEAARGVAFLSLNAGGNPIYVGPSSGFSWARFVLAGMAGASRAEGGNFSPTRSKLDTKGPLDTGPRTASTPLLADDALSGIPDEIANRIYDLVFQHVQSQFCFMDWIWLRSIFPHRVKICQAAKAPDASKATRTAAFFVWMLFALGSALGQPFPALAAPENYYTKAMEHLETIVGLHDLKNVQALLLMVIYSFQAPSAPSTWFLTGIAMRLCSSLGLHRKLPAAQARRLSPYLLQLRRRIFWSAYLVDRMLATSLGRPTSIADEEIDIELPLDRDVDSLTLDVVKPHTSMTSALHFIHLARLGSSIRKKIYRLDEERCKDPTESLQALDDWEARIPAIANDAACTTVPCCTKDWFLAKSFDAKLCILRPLTASKTSNPEHLKILAQSAAEACEIQKRLHQDPVGTLSLETLRTVFLNGLTLLHAARLSPEALSPAVLQRAIRACSNTLYSYSQAFKGATAYFDCFEELASLVIDTNSSTPSTCNTPLFQTLWEEIPSVMTNETGDSFINLLDSLGVPLDNAFNQFYDSTNLGGDLTHCETGFNIDPFALGGGGLW